jgi:hypothetical protein
MSRDAQLGSLEAWILGKKLSVFRRAPRWIFPAEWSLQYELSTRPSTFDLLSHNHVYFHGMSFHGPRAFA